MRNARSLLTSALFLAGACSGLYRVERSRIPDLAWPPESPRVRLESLLPLAGDLTRGGRVLDWLGGGRGDELFRRPFAVAWDGDDLLVADPDTGRIGRIRPDGSLLSAPAGAVDHPIGLAVCDPGIVVTDSRQGRVALLGEDLHRLRWLAEDLDRPTGVACRDERIFVVETGRHRLVILEADGARSYLGRRGAAPGELNFPTAVAVEGGSLWVGDTLNFRLQRLDASSGRPLATFGRLGDAPGEMPRLKGMAVDGAGHLWVSDAHLDRVSLYRSDGVLLLSLGGTGGEPGELSFPAGLAAHPDGRVAVVDSLNRRIQVFRLLEPGGGRAP